MSEVDRLALYRQAAAALRGLRQTAQALRHMLDEPAADCGRAAAARIGVLAADDSAADALEQLLAAVRELSR